MPIGKITTDYFGRKKDISIIKGADPNTLGKQNVTLEFGKISTYCAGVQKLIQRYMIIFLTLLGSQPKFPTFGTDFYSRLTGSNLVSRADMIHLFNFANLTTIKTIKEHQSTKTDIPEDEQLNTAYLNSLLISGDTLSLKVVIETSAGSTVDFVVPLPA